MARIRPSRDIHPVSTFRARTAALLGQVQRSGRPLFLTQRGRSAAVVLDVEQYEALLDELALLRDVRDGEAQLAAGRGVPHDAAARQLRRRLPAG